MDYKFKANEYLMDNEILANEYLKDYVLFSSIDFVHCVIMSQTTSVGLSKISYSISQNIVQYVPGREIFSGGLFPKLRLPKTTDVFGPNRICANGKDCHNLSDVDLEPLASHVPP